MPVNDDKGLETEADQMGRLASGKSTGMNGGGASGGGAMQAKMAPIQRYTGNGELGKLSARYESNGNPGTVSSGNGDPGGVSYGSYQFATNMGTPQRFLAHSAGSKYASGFAGMAPGTTAFSNKWRQIAQREPAAFQAAQHEFVQATYYDVLAANTIRDAGFNPNSRSQVLQDVIWSTAVQHGTGTNVITRALGTANAANMSDEGIIRMIYAERGRTNANGTLVRFSGSSASVQAGVKKRFINEMNDALNAVFDKSKRVMVSYVRAGRNNNVGDLVFVQNGLKQLGYLSQAQITSDGTAGNSIPNTDSAIRRFQSANSGVLGAADGVFGQNSERVMLELTGNGGSTTTVTVQVVDSVSTSPPSLQKLHT